MHKAEAGVEAEVADEATPGEKEDEDEGSRRPTNATTTTEARMFKKIAQ